MPLAVNALLVGIAPVTIAECRERLPVLLATAVAPVPHTVVSLFGEAETETKHICALFFDQYC